MSLPPADSRPAAIVDLATTIDAERARLWSVFCAAARRAHVTLAAEDGVVAGQAWGAFLRTYESAHGQALGRASAGVSLSLTGPEAMAAEGSR